MITIGQLAQYAGVTVKAVRVYHRRGLLAEPPRDSSGYRRYRAEDAIDLVRIRTLAQAGVPLARIKDLLAADPAEFTAAITDIDRALQQRAEEIKRTRERLARLKAGDGLFVSADVAGYLDRLRDLGISERAINMERDIWILLHSVEPEQAAAWAADKLDAVADAEFGAIYRDYDTAFDWSPDDPRLTELAERTARWLAARETGSGRTTPAIDPNLIRLVNECLAVTSPAWDRLGRLSRRTRGRHWLASPSPGAAT
jgi:DNA-binding transcriptional MerR regulator